VVEDDLELFRRIVTEPGFAGPNWYGYRSPAAAVRQFAEDGFLGPDHSRLMVDVADQTAGFVAWSTASFSALTKHWEIGIVLLPEWRGRGVGWRAQAMLCDYLFENTPVQRIQAGTQPDNTAERKALEKAGFQLEGILRAAEFRAGQWRDGCLYSRLRDDPSPL
jgi:RimJ/RimL family protein N-acetyltransferase